MSPDWAGVEVMRQWTLTMATAPRSLNVSTTVLSVGRAGACPTAPEMARSSFGWPDEVDLVHRDVLWGVATDGCIGADPNSGVPENTGEHPTTHDTCPVVSDQRMLSERQGRTDKQNPTAPLGQVAFDASVVVQPDRVVGQDPTALRPRDVGGYESVVA